MGLVGQHGCVEEVPSAELPPGLIAALIAVEDRRFREHPGVDVRAVASSVLSRRTRGASTLTMQLSRDGAGRIRRVRVTSLPSQAVLYERWYTWAADQIVSIDVCYQGQTGAPLNEFSAPVGVTPLGYDSEKRLSVNAVRTTGLNPNRVENGHTYEYDASGNRIKESIGAGSTFGWAGTVGWGGQLNRVAPATLMSESGSNRGYVTYAYDLDGRPTGVSGAVDSLGAANWTYVTVRPRAS